MGRSAGYTVLRSALLAGYPVEQRHLPASPAGSLEPLSTGSQGSWSMEEFKEQLLAPGLLDCTMPGGIALPQWLYSLGCSPVSLGYWSDWAICHLQWCFFTLTALVRLEGDTETS